MSEEEPVSDALRGALPATSVRIYLPDERLRSFATFYYFVECDGQLDDFLYPEWGNVRFPLRGEWYASLGEGYPDGPLGTTLFGHTDRAARIATGGGKLAGFGLTPLGWQRLIGEPADALANRVIDPGMRLGMSMEGTSTALAAHETDAESVALFDALLLDRLEHSEPNPDWALTIDLVLRDRPHDVAAFAKASGISTRTLTRWCHRLFGFGPKRLLRRQRFLDTLGWMRVIDTPRYTDVIDPEYVDQAHFIREFGEFMGLSPRKYMSAPRPLMGQAALVQMAAGIPLSFQLPPQPPTPAQPSAASSATTAPARSPPGPG